MSFIENMRMNSIYPTEYMNPRVRPYDPLAEAQLREEEEQRFYRMNQFQHNLNPKIGNQVMGQPIQPNQPMNYVLDKASLQGNPIDIFNRSRDLADFNRDTLEERTKLNTAKLSEKSEIDRAKLAQNKDLGQQKIDISKQRAAVYEFKAKHPGLRIVIPKGGNITAIDPNTGKAIDTGIDSGTLTDEERLELTNANSMNQIEARGNIQKDIQKTRGTQNLSEIAARAAGQIDVNNNKPTKDEIPTQTRVRQINKAHEIINTKPELGKFIKLGEGNTFEIIPPSEGFFGGSEGPTKEQYDELNRLIYGDTTKATSAKSPAKVTSPARILSPTPVKQADPLGIR